MAVVDWLLDSDPSISWQVMRDLTHEQTDVIAAERSRVATEGWGARLLALQAPDGQWGGRPWSHDWTDTFHALELGWKARNCRRQARTSSSDAARSIRLGRSFGTPPDDAACISTNRSGGRSLWRFAGSRLPPSVPE